MLRETLVQRLLSAPDEIDTAAQAVIQAEEEVRKAEELLELREATARVDFFTKTLPALGRKTVEAERDALLTQELAADETLRKIRAGARTAREALSIARRMHEVATNRFKALRAVALAQASGSVP